MRNTQHLRAVSTEERAALEKLARARTEEARLVERATLILALADGDRPSHVATRLGLSRMTVYTWLARFNADGLAGLRDRTRSGRPATYPPDARSVNSSPPRSRNPRSSDCPLRVGPLIDSKHI